MKKRPALRIASMLCAVVVSAALFPMTASANGGAPPGLASITTEELKVLSGHPTLEPFVYAVQKQDIVLLQSLESPGGPQTIESVDWDKVTPYRCDVLSMLHNEAVAPPPRAGWLHTDERMFPSQPDSESQDLVSPEHQADTVQRQQCLAARLQELHWVDGAPLGVPVYYARDLDGTLTCVSAIGFECLRSDPGLDLNRLDPADRLIARTASCTSPVPGGLVEQQCTLVKRGLKSTKKSSIQAAYNRQTATMDRLFSNALNDATSEVERGMDYHATRAQLQREAQDARGDAKSACHLHAKGGGWCSRARDAAKAAENAVPAWDHLRKVGVTLGQAGNRLHYAQDWHKLHETWAMTDTTHFAALMRVESKELAELKAVLDEYTAVVAQERAAYDALEAEWKRSQSGILDAEQIPLIGPIIRSIEAYENDPSSRNLRKIFLGLFGPVGEVVDGIVQLTADEEMGPGKQSFLVEALHEITSNKDFGTALEKIAADFEVDLGDEVIEAARETGLWSADGKDPTPPMSSFRDFDHLVAEAEALQIGDWLASDPQAAGFRARFSAPKGAHPFAGRVDGASMTDQKASVAFERGVEAVFAHAMGTGYADVAKSNAKYAKWTQRQVTGEMLKVLSDPAYAQQIQPRWVKSDTLGDRYAGMMFDDEQAVILLNSDRLTSKSPDLAKYYFEELGHLTNWWRCEIFDVAVNKCTGRGEIGARFRDAVMLDEKNAPDALPAQLLRLPEHAESDLSAVLFAGGTSAKLEGWSDFRTLKLAGGGKFSFLMRAGIDLDSARYPGIADEFDLEMAVGAPTMTKLGDPWKKSGTVCETRDLGSAKDCDVPTLTMAFAFRDAIKYSITGVPTVKNSVYGKSGVDLAPGLIRKHGVRLFFQPKPGRPDEWELKSEHSIYFKEFSFSADAKVDGTKMLEGVAGKKLPAPHTLQVAGKAALEGMYVVEIPVKDKELLALWVSLDVGSAVIGCVGGFLIAVVSEQDPVPLCHAGSDVFEGLETAFEGLDKRPTTLFAVDATVAVPLSVEYKAALGGPKNSPPRVILFDDFTHPDDILPASPDRPGPLTVTPLAAEQAKGIGAKVSNAFGTLKNSKFTALGVFRPRVGWDIADRVVNRGDYGLPSSGVKE